MSPLRKADSISNRAWSKGIALIFLSSLFTSAWAQSPKSQGRVQWARLKTPYEHWSRHTNTESNFLMFVREKTSLEIDPVWASAEIENLTAITAYPFLYAEGIQKITTPTAQKNLREYLLRGGFLCIEGCINGGVNPDPADFFRMQVQRLKEIIPEATVSSLPPDHEIYSCYFPVSTRLIQTNYPAAWKAQPMYAVTHQGRMVGIMSFLTLKCAWSFPDPVNVPGLRVEAMRMMINIYTYAVTH